MNILNVTELHALKMVKKTVNLSQQKNKEWGEKILSLVTGSPQNPE